jgi:glycine hydroxymethyltransferase
MNKIYEEYLNLCKEFEISDKNTIPLCAAENYISSFVKQPLISNFEGRYSCVNNDGSNSFLEGKYIEKLKLLLQKQCNFLFNSKYTNADTLTGINCFTVCAMSLLKCGDKVLLTTPDQGGHPSIPVILNTLQVDYTPIPYDFENYQIDYARLNSLCKNNKYSFIILCQSDLINTPDLNKMKIGNLGIIYDATQTLGLIAGKCIENPLNYSNTVLIGGAHKTLPAPSCGLIMTNNIEFKSKLENNISPNYLRNVQPNHIAGMLLALIEQEKFGFQYQHKIIDLANLLAYHLDKYGFKIAKCNKDKYTNTHQLFLLTKKEDAKTFYINSKKYNISLNLKNKRLFNNYGIRIGTQQIARYNWQETEIIQLAELLYLISQDANSEKINKLRKSLINKKIPYFTYDEIFIE